MPRRTRELRELAGGERLVVGSAGDEAFAQPGRHGGSAGEVAAQDVAMVGMQAGEMEPAAGQAAERPGLGGVAMDQRRPQGGEPGDDRRQAAGVTERVQPATELTDGLHLDPAAAQLGAEIAFTILAAAGQHASRDGRVPRARAPAWRPRAPVRHRSGGR